MTDNTTTLVATRLKYLREEVEIAVESLKKGSLPELIIYQLNLFKLGGDHDRCFNRDL